MVMELKMDTHKKIRVHLSALVDGNLAPSDVELALAALQSADGQQTWDTYFRIGDELRAQSTPPLSEGFSARLAARLDAEPLPLRRSRTAADNAPGRRASQAPRRAPSSNGGGAPLSFAEGDGKGELRAEGSEGSVPASGELPADGKAVVSPKPAIASVS